MKTPRELPKIEIAGKTYYVDRKLAQLRNVKNPHDYIDFGGFSPLEQFILMQALKGNVSIDKEFDDGTALIKINPRRKVGD